jgi:uncharacterized protein with HEPN domain
MSKDEIIDNLDFILQSIELITERFSQIKAADDFVVNAAGITLLDAITMRLQVIGETVKQIQKTNPTFFNSYPEIEWGKIAKFRDFVSHHYEHVDHEIVYDICRMHITTLVKTIRKIRQDLQDFSH